MIWSLECLQPHQRDLLQVLAPRFPAHFHAAGLALSLPSRLTRCAQVHLSNGRCSHTFPPKVACAVLPCLGSAVLMQTCLQELYRCSNGGWVALSAFAVYTSFKMPVRLSLTARPSVCVIAQQYLLQRCTPLALGSCSCSAKGITNLWMKCLLLATCRPTQVFSTAHSPATSWNPKFF